MNQVILIGRLSKDVTIRQTQDGSAVASGTIAVQKKYKNKDGEYEANFINFVAFKTTADLIARYFQKGDRIGLVGTWENRTYQAQDGTTRYVSEVFVENIEFLQEKREQQGNNQYQGQPNQYQRPPQQQVNNYYQQQPNNNYQQPQQQANNYYQQPQPLASYQGPDLSNVDMQFDIKDEDLPF